MATSTLSDRGQIVIPAEIRQRLQLQRGDRFAFDTDDHHLILTLLPRNPLLSLYGAFAGPDSLTDALLEEHRMESAAEDAR